MHSDKKDDGEQDYLLVQIEADGSPPVTGVVEGHASDDQEKRQLRLADQEDGEESKRHERLKPHRLLLKEDQRAGYIDRQEGEDNGYQSDPHSRVPLECTAPMLFLRFRYW